MKVLGLAFVVIVFLTIPITPQISAVGQHFQVFTADGASSTVSDVVLAAQKADAIFLGEQHDDAVGHVVELDLLQQAVNQFSPKRKVALSLEMFERDVQVVLNEYLAGLITEPLFLASSRPWSNYKTDYRPLIEFAKEKKLDIIAANAPRRYVNMVSRNGRQALETLSDDAKRWLAPYPYGQPSAIYAAKFKNLMSSSPEAKMGIDNILSSQALWDATMADSVANYLKRNKGAVVIQINGGFHTESRLGLVEQLLKYRPKTRVLVVTMRQTDDLKTFDKIKDTDTGDFVVLTDAKQPRGK